MRALKLDLKKWNNEELGNVEIKRKQFAFDELDDTKESRHLNDDEKLEKYHIYIDLEKTILLEEICVR